MTSSGTSHGPRRRPREATSTTPCRSGTTIGPNSARTGAVHRSSAQSRPTGPRAVRAHPSPASTAATGATHHDRHARAMMKQGLGAAFVPPVPHPGRHQRTVTWNDPTQHSPRRRFAAAAARGILYDIDVHSFRLDGAPRSSCLLAPSRNSAAHARGRSFVVRVIGTRGVMSGCLSQVYSCAPGHGGVAVAAGTYGAGCCARARAAVVAAASEATRGLQNERFERFERPPVNSPTYVAGQPPCLWESMQPQELELNRAASITRASSGASGSRIELQLATTAALLTIVRRKHGMPQRPVMQYLQGVALRRTCRIDGVRVTVHCAQRRPSAAHRNAPLRGGGGEVETRAAALRRAGPRQRCLDVPAGVETR